MLGNSHRSGPLVENRQYLESKLKARGCFIIKNINMKDQVNEVTVSILI